MKTKILAHRDVTCTCGELLIYLATLLCIESCDHNLIAPSALMLLIRI